MKRKVPLDAFEQYVAMGPERSYAALAEKYGVTKRALTRLAGRERWAERLSEIERKARERSDERLVTEIEEMRVRHLRSLKAVNARALAALKQFPLSSAMEAVRSMEIAIKLERLIAGEPSERSEVSIEEVTRREIRTLLMVDEGDEGDDQEEDESGDQGDE